MPGLTIVAADAGGRPDTPTLLPELRALEHFPDYATTVLVDTPSLLVACTRYPEYPLAVLERAPYVLVLEGRIYAPEDAAARLLDHAERVLDEPERVDDVARWLRDADGDFLAVVVDVERDRAVCLNDRYGRLPVYRRRDAHGITLSRELSLLSRRRSADRLAMAEYLVFGHPLGRATLVAGVERLEPATLVHLPSASTTTLVGPDFEAYARPALPPRALAERIAGALVAACRARVQPDRTTVVALSGGIDSRLVAGSLARCGVRAIGMTHLDHRGSETSDAAVARRVAARAGMAWELVRMPPPTGSDVAALLRLKSGANHLGMSRVLPFLDTVVARHGRRIVCFTGDQGDRVLGPITPLTPLADDHALATYLLRREAILPPAAVAAAVGIREADVVDDLAARLASYPERRTTLKYVHFLFCERALRWAFEGEDRNRCWFWSVTPFFAPDVFELAMAVRPSGKALHRLRIDVMAAVAPELVHIPDVTAGARLTSRAFRIRQGLRSMARRTIFRTFDGDTERRLLGLLRPVDGYDARSAVLRLVRQQLEAGPAGSYFQREATERILGRAGSIAREQFSVLFTVTSLIDAIEGNGATLAQFAGTAFV